MRCVLPAFLLTLMSGCAQAAESLPANYREVARYDLQEIAEAPVGWVLSVHDPITGERDGTQVEREQPTFTCLRIPSLSADCQPQLNPNGGNPAGLQDVQISGDKLRIGGQWQPVIRVTARTIAGVSGWEVVTRYFKPDGTTLVPLGTITQSNMGNISILRDGPLEGALLTAQAQWMGLEAHYDDHHYLITVMAPTHSGFRPMLSYLTQTLYPAEPEDPRGAEAILNGERRKVESLFQQLYGNAPDLVRILLPPASSSP